MLALLTFILACYGATSILTTGTIFEPVRARLKWKFLRCSQCMGFWVGAVAYVAFYFTGIDLFTDLFVGTFVFACISSGTSYLLSSVVDDEGFKLNHHS
jgi:hypothetical protein